MRALNGGSFDFGGDMTGRVIAAGLFGSALAYLAGLIVETIVRLLALLDWGRARQVLDRAVAPANSGASVSSPAPLEGRQSIPELHLHSRDDMRAGPEQRPNTPCPPPSVRQDTPGSLPAIVRQCSDRESIEGERHPSVRPRRFLESCGFGASVPIASRDARSNCFARPAPQPPAPPMDLWRQSRPYYCKHLPKWPKLCTF